MNKVYLLLIWYSGHLFKVPGLYAISCTWNCTGSTHYCWSGPFPDWDHCYCRHVTSVQVSFSAESSPKVYIGLTSKNFCYTGSCVTEMPPSFTSSSALLCSACWLSLCVVLIEQGSMEVALLCQPWFTTSHWQLWCGWGQRLCSCSRSWSLCSIVLLPNSSLLCHSSAGVRN